MRRTYLRRRTRPAPLGRRDMAPAPGLGEQIWLNKYRARSERTSSWRTARRRGDIINEPLTRRGRTDSLVYEVRGPRSLNPRDSGCVLDKIRTLRPRDPRPAAPAPYDHFRVCTVRISFEFSTMNHGHRNRLLPINIFAKLHGEEPLPRTAAS